MKSCLNCKYGKETIYNGVKTCGNKSSVFVGNIVDERDLCMEHEQEDEADEH